MCGTPPCSLQRRCRTIGSTSRRHPQKAGPRHLAHARDWPETICDKSSSKLRAALLQPRSADQRRSEFGLPGRAGCSCLARGGADLGTPLVDRLKDSGPHHPKKLRTGSGGRSEIRIIFAFDPTRSALLLLGGDKAGNWNR
ncbi:type II toxin-antitoxin system RelE/ParE family toxin [Streptomyces sp. S07_1.15]|uniref:type II toxin-antitoxin system RelE/ParE family toxin n=1 Tax=Streptomyces sp. S07_1.15 TaxID=2873925 RepID=UPI001D15BC2F|nr:type II toxin-antitoxin system RelE/ParE family toxin [Streptomyces sp. S07_1.15]MCC3653392.1 type II toxin-antitoxin system RelE/ParE family toxin [Streptomyces sp. S07_1.15]